VKIVPLLKAIGFLFLLVLIPTLAVIRLEWDAILPIIIYLQLLLIWAQAEIGLRQHFLFTAQFKPFFDIRSQHIASTPSSEGIWIRNVSRNPAYNIMIGRLLDERNEPIDPGQWKDKVPSNFIGSLAPNGEELLCCLDEEMAHSEFAIELSYFDQLGELGTVYMKARKEGSFLLIPQTKEPPGIFLNTFEYFALFFRFLSFKRHFKR